MKFFHRTTPFPLYLRFNLPRMPRRCTDLTVLNNLFKGDRALVMEWTGLYLEEAPGCFKRVEDALKAGDARALAFAVHELRPQAHYLGAPKLLELLTLIGGTAADQGAGACTGAVEELLELARRIEMELFQDRPK